MTRTPPLQHVLGTRPERWEVTEVDAENVDAALFAAKIPTHGEVRAVASEHVTVERSVMKRERA